MIKLRDLVVPLFSLLMVGSQANVGLTQTWLDKQSDPIVEEALQLLSFARLGQLENMSVARGQVEQNLKEIEFRLLTRIEYNRAALAVVSELWGLCDLSRRESERELHRTELGYSAKLGLPLPSRKTLELLLQDNWVELQRVEWELAALSIEAESKSRQARRKAAELRLYGQELAVDGIRIKLESAKSRLELMTQRYDQGDIHKSQIDEGVVPQLENELKMAEVNLQAARAEFAAEMGADNESMEEQRLKLSARREQLKEQIKSLQTQRMQVARVEQLQQRLTQESQQVLELQRKLDTLQVQQKEYETLLDFIRAQLATTEPSEKAETNPKKHDADQSQENEGKSE